jgi:hypothetical protein
MGTTTEPRPTQELRPTQFDTATIMGGLYGDGIIGLKGAFPREWVEAMREDIERLFEDALRRPGGAVGRGPKRYYVEVHPEDIRGFLDLATHPWVTTVCEAVLGPEYKIVEIGFDVPGPGAVNQPWHRDFPAPPETLVGRRLTSLAFNLTGVDVFEDMGPFEVAPGTQWDEPTGFEHGMFPPKSLYPRYEARRQRLEIAPRHLQVVMRGVGRVGSVHPHHQYRPRLIRAVGRPAMNGQRRPSR